MKNYKTLKNNFLIASIAIIPFTANAQKLPNIQTGSLRGPDNVKIDGKATEWDNQFQANNHATDFFYTLANDDNNLYVIIQAIDPAIIRRIINGGITLTVNTSGKKDDKTGASITYPVFDKNNRFMPSFSGVGKRLSMPLNGGSIDIRGGFGANGNNALDARPMAGPPVNSDSLALVNNKNFTDKAKYIRISGINGLDTLISVYNEDGIKASALFNNKMAYTYELSVSLKQLDLSVTNPIKITYQLRINEVQEQGIVHKLDASGNATGFSIGKGSIAGQPATYFWGEYTLARK